MKTPEFLKPVQLDEHGDLVEVSLATRIRRILTVILVLAVNVFLILRAAVSCDVALSETMVLSDLSARNLAQAALHLPKPQDFSNFTARDDRAQGAELYRLFNSGASDEAGHLQVTDVSYIDGAGILHLSLKQNTRHYPELNEDGESSISFAVRVYDAEGEERYYDNARTVRQTKGNYVYTRVLFEDLSFIRDRDYVTLYLLDTLTSDRLLTVTLHGTESATARDSLNTREFLYVES